MLVAAEKRAEKAELLNNYFCSIFRLVTPVVNNIPTYDSLTDKQIMHKELSFDEVRGACHE